MNEYIKKLTSPTADSALLTDAKSHIKVTGTEEDSLLTVYLNGVVATCENKLQTAIYNTQFELHCRSFCQHISLQKKWVSAINSVKYYDEDGAQQTVGSSDYSLQDFKVPNVLYFNEDYEFPNTDEREFPVTVNFNSGFGSASAIIPNVRNAIFLEFADRYENRQNEVVDDRVQLVMFNTTAETLLAEERLWL